jgi:hypothetical protein
MSIHAKEPASCVGKQAFPSKKVALALAKRTRRKYEVRLTPYKCEDCGRWHNGKSTEQINDLSWVPQKHKDRPTPERKARGTWELHKTEIAGIKVARVIDSTPIDRLEHVGVLSNDQASSGRLFEELYRSATETPGIRDSLTLWEPKGYESDDGNVRAVQERRELYALLGGQKDSILRHVCVEHNEPKGAAQIGMLRESLNACVQFFKK